MRLVIKQKTSARKNSLNNVNVFDLILFILQLLFDEDGARHCTLHTEVDLTFFLQKFYFSKQLVDVFFMSLTINQIFCFNSENSVKLRVI